MEITRVRAKFTCNSITKVRNWANNPDHPFLYTYAFSPVGDSSPENKTFWAATPSGKVELGCVLVDAFEVGKEYYLDFIEAVPV